jgi:uncharacterized protein GlcG (DUF336 family)
VDSRALEGVNDVNLKQRLQSAWLSSLVFAALTGCGVIGPPPPPQQTTQVASLSSTDVQQVVQAAASSVVDPLVIAVVDRAGNILGIYDKMNAPATGTANFGNSAANAHEVAVALARTAAFFSNNQAPLSSRTVRFISGIHFPPGVDNAPSAALYGIENTNRGCVLGPGIAVPPARSIDGSMTGLGVLTGKADTMDSDAQAVNPGGVPLFKAGEAVGGIGVVAARMDVAEYAAFTGALNAGFLPLLKNVPNPGAVLIDGIALPFVLQMTLPAGDSAGSANGSYFMGPNSSPGPVPEGDLVVVHDGPIGGLTTSEVSSIVSNAVATANQTRAVIRLPLGQRTRMVIAVVDLDGTILALRRMPDATVFSIDVAVGKARNMVYFNSPTVNPSDLPGVPAGTALTNRTLGFGGQPLFPSGINASSPGPFFTPLYINDVNNPCTQGSQPPSGNQQSGIVFFPGSEGLYRNGKLVGGLGVSGDGVEQDDYVTSGGAQGWEPPAAIRADQITINGVRLPYMKFPRDPTQ